MGTPAQALQSSSPYDIDNSSCKKQWKLFWLVGQIIVVLKKILYDQESIQSIIHLYSLLFMIHQLIQDHYKMLQNKHKRIYSKHSVVALRHELGIGWHKGTPG